jgi:hypothetical protein
VSGPWLGPNFVTGEFRLNFFYWSLLDYFESLALERAPFGSKPRADRETYMRLFEQASAREFPEIDQLEVDLGYSISKDWLDSLALHTQVVVKKSPLNWQHGRLLYAALRLYLSLRERESPVTVFETGTARGFSALVMAKALEDSQSDGQVVTIDTLSHSRNMFWNCIDDVQGKKSRADLLAAWPQELKRIIFLQGMTPRQLPRIGLERIGFAFLDAQHTFSAVLAEFDWVSARQKKGDVIVFDDVTPRQFDGVVEAIASIQRQGMYEIEYCGVPEERGYAVARKILD